MSGIELKHVNQIFGKKQALTDINLTFEPNHIYGLLGRNGAGKSTMLNLISNRIPLSKGSITLNNHPIAEHDQSLSRLYLMSEYNMYPERMRVKEVFQVTSRSFRGFDMEFAMSLARQFNLDLKARIGKLSTGYNSIAKIITAMAVDVDYVFLDEPVLGLDANHRDLFYSELIKNFAERPRTFVISTHLIEEIATMIDHVMVIDEGHVLVNDSTDNIMAQAHTITGPEADVAAYTDGLNVIGHDALGATRAKYVYGPLDDERVLPDTVTLESMPLQKLFVHLTNSAEVVGHEN